jgi:hypothetical protein
VGDVCGEGVEVTEKGRVGERVLSVEETGHEAGQEGADGMNSDDLRKELARLQAMESQLVVAEQENVLKNSWFLPTQEKFNEAYHDPDVKTLIMTAANQSGKTHVGGCRLSATLKGYEPWSGKKLPIEMPARVAILLRDYDNHARVYVDKMLELWPNGALKIEYTQQRAPRVIRCLETGSFGHIFTHDQDPARGAGGTWDELHIDEPCPKAHYIELSRGLQRTGGKTLMTMTPVSEPWIFDDIYSQAANNGGDRKDIAAFTAWPDENKKSNGGFLDDEAVERYRETLSEEELEARKYGRWMHLIGRVHKQFSNDVHILDRPPVDIEQCCLGVTVDPHDRLPFAIGWFAVTPGNDIVFIDEWPREPFEKIRQCDKTVEDYARLLSKGPSPVWRIMDPNYGRRRSLSSGLTIADEFQLRGVAFDTTVTDDLAAGHKRVQEYLAWDREKPLDSTNQPKLYVLRRCRNIIKGFHNYVWDDWKGKIAEGKAAKQKPREAYKHFMDVVRYTVMARVRYIQPGELDNAAQEPRIFSRGLNSMAPKASIKSAVLYGSKTASVKSQGASNVARYARRGIRRAY